MQDGGIGYIIRDHEGNFCAAGQNFIDNKSDLQCQALAIKLGLQTAITKKITHLQLETDS